MCGPKFCAMRITEDVRKFAAEHGAAPEQGILVGLQEKAKEFRDKGGEIYVPETARS